MLLTKFLDKGRSRVPPEASGRGATHILVVARDRQALYEYASRAFAGTTVEVVLDRRRAQRRRSADRPRMPERRRGDRRLTLEVDDHLRRFGWAVVRRDVFRAFGLSRLSASR